MGFNFWMFAYVLRIEKVSSFCRNHTNIRCEASPSIEQAGKVNSTGLQLLCHNPCRVLQSVLHDFWGNCGQKPQGLNSLLPDMVYLWHVHPGLVARLACFYHFDLRA